MVGGMLVFPASSLANSSLSKKSLAFIEYQKKKKQFEQRRKKILNAQLKQLKNQGMSKERPGRAQYEKTLRQFEQRRKQAFLLHKQKQISYEKRLKRILRDRQARLKKLKRQERSTKNIENLY